MPSTVPRRGTRAAALAGAYLILVGLYWWFAHDRLTAFGFLDEFIYGKLAQSVGWGEGLSYQGLAVSGYRTLYPFAIAPAWALFDDPRTAYHAALAINAVLMPAVFFPAYAIARRVAPFGWAVVAGVAAALTPAMAWASMLMTESLAYPLMTLALLAAVEAVRRPGLLSGALAVGAAGAAAATRSQLLAALPLLALAIAIDIARHGSGWRARAGEHRWLIAAFAAVLFAALAASVLGLRESLVGTYAGETERGIKLGELIEYVPRYLGVIAVATLLLPLAAVAALAARRENWRDREVGPLLCVAIAAVITFALVGAWASTTLSPELRERYVFYPAPVLAAAWVALPGRCSLRALAIGAGVIALALAPVWPAIYGSASNEWTDHTIGSVLAARPLPLIRETLVIPDWLGGEIQFWAAAIAVMAACAIWALRRWGSGVRAAVFAVPVLVFGLALVAARMHDLEAQAAAQYSLKPKPPDFLDRMGIEEAALIRTSGTDVFDQWHIELWNRSLTRVWRAPDVPAPNEVGQACLLLRGPGGTLVPREPCAGRVLPRHILLSDRARRWRIPGARLLYKRDGATLWELPPDTAPRLVDEGPAEAQ